MGHKENGHGKRKKNEEGGPEATPPGSEKRIGEAEQ